MTRQTVKNCGPLHRDDFNRSSYGYCRNDVGTLNGAISSILGAGHGMAERDAAGCPSKSVACPRAWVLNSVAKFVYCVQTLEGRLDEAEIAANFGLQKRSLFWSAFWSFSLAIGARKSGH